nr:hypothetical protein [Tanacetum cinerariifolium]
SSSSEIVDFLNGSHIRYALTKSLTMYVSLIKKFWQTATVKTVNNGEQEIIATVDGKEFTVTEASVRRHEMQMGTHTFVSKYASNSSRRGEGLEHPFEPQPPPSTAQPTNEEPIPNVVSSSQPKAQTPRKALIKDDRVERAATTAASLDVEQASGNINRTQSTTMPNVPLPREIGVGGSPRCQKAMGVSLLRLGEAHSQEDQLEDQLGVLSTSKVLVDESRKNVQTYTRRRRAVSTGSGRISDASRLFSPAKESVSTAIKDKGKCKIEESEDEQTKRTKLQQEQDRLGHEAAEEWENIRARVEADEELTQRLQAEERNNYTPNQLKKLSFDEIKKLFENTMKRVNIFVPIETEVKGRASELVVRSSQATIIDSAEVGSSKRAAEAELDYEGSKRQKTYEASGDELVMLWSLVKERFSSTEPTDDKERTLWVELKRLFEPDTDDKLWKPQRERISIVKRGSDFDVG